MHAKNPRRLCIDPIGNHGTRDYSDVEKRLKALQSPHLTLQVIGIIQEYPMYQVTLGDPSPEKSGVLLTAGMHGDEPAPVEAILQFLERDLSEISKKFHILFMPCMNPTGYMANTRENARGQDINRAFEIDTVPEANLIKYALQDLSFAVHLDMHEDYDGKGTYYYEQHKDRKWLAPTIAEKSRQIGPLDTQSSPEPNDEHLISAGVYEVSPTWGEAGFSPYVYAHHAGHVMITETASTAWPLDKRVAVHLLAIDELLKYYHPEQPYGNDPHEKCHSL